MGKAVTSPATPTTATARMKKKGRPPKNSPHSLHTLTPDSLTRRSTRRNPNHPDSPPEFDDEEDDDDERKDKKVKLVVRLPQSDDDAKLDEKNHNPHTKRHFEELGGSGSEGESENRNGFSKKRKIDSGSGDGDTDRDKEVGEGTEALVHGSLLNIGPTTPLPERKLLVFILDRLQKKDTYGVFSEPVDPEELPDYFDIIKQPMDFGTVRQKLDGSIYKNLEGLEADVLLICSNAMQYNAVDTIYYRQARTIQELAKRDFANLRHEGEDGAPQPKVVRRGRPPNSKNQKKPVETSFVNRLAAELTSGASLANEGKASTSSISFSATIPKKDDVNIGSNYHNLRRGPTSSRFRSTDSLVACNHPRYGDSEWSNSWNTEFPASILRADMKYGSKQYAMDENRRDTYTKCPSPTNSFRISFNSVIDVRQLVPVGLHEALGYARSHARYAEILGPIAWKMASRKIEAVLPPGVQYGPGWLGEPRPSQGLSFSSDIQKSSDTVAGAPSSSSDIISAEGTSKTPGKSMFAPNLHTPYRNGFTRNFGQSLGSDVTPSKDLQHCDHLLDTYHLQKLMMPEPENYLNQQPPALQQRISELGRVPGGSPPHSSIPIGSPKNPDLALQL